MKKYLLIVFTLLVISYQLPTASYAADASGSGDLSSKLKALQDSIASKAAQIKQTISQKLQNKAFVGKITQKDTDKLTINFKDKTHTIKITQDTQYTAAAKSLKSLSEGDYIAALGDTDQDGNLVAKKIGKFPDGLDNDPDLVFGMVTNITDNSFTLSSKGTNLNVGTTSKTTFLMGDQSASFSDLKLNKPVIVVGTKSGDSIKPRTIYILPYTTSLKTKTASPSGTPVTPIASPSAKPKK